MGSRGHSPMVNLVLGSVSSAVSHKAHCPVMIIH
jgi:nucleotide-binding universal stress UspA family protein